MKNTTQLLQWLLVVLYLVGVITTSRSTEAKEVVTIVNALGPDLVLTVHCKSKDDDLGIHNIPYKDGNYSFTFKPNIWGTTQYWCNFLWIGGNHYFDIYIDMRDYPICNNVCSWQIYPNGPCLYNRSTQKFDLCHGWNPPK
ncbi:S-protein homolog 5-like [Ziziphus jujuba]|uniref:S-protein homolog n=1 Tax=Ziziphus jujuba TaxID=326968 RepID=A0A6P6FT49_ZIZJJ|nr:S-protein homolog 5-like [Ziziphus jujuba]